MLSKLLRDRASLLAVATRAAQGAAGLVTAVFIVKFFSADVQGYYYTFANLLALQVFFELGLSGVITTFAAHEWGKLSLHRDGRIQGEPMAMARLKVLARKVLVWYSCGAVLILVFLVLAGAWFLGLGEAQSAVDWKHPWFAMCALAAFTFLLTPAWALLAGCGQLATLNAFRLAETAARYAVLWACMALGASLWSAVVAIAVSAVGGCVFLGVRYRPFLTTLLAGPAAAGFQWLKEVVPLQARIAISWISGYFAFSVFVPAMFHFQGAEQAGRMGMTWALVTGLSGISTTWLQAHAPRFATMVAGRNFAALDRTAWHTALIGVAVFLAIAVAGLAGLHLLGVHFPAIADRLLPIEAVALFLLAELLHQVSMVQSTYLRAFKREPFLWVSVISGVVIGGGTLLLTPSLGAYGPAASYLAGIAIALVLGTLIFARCRARWTATAAE